MQFLIHTSRNPAYNDDDFAPGLPGEEARLRELYAAQVFRHVWHRSDRPGAVILAEADDVPQATAAVDSLPLVHAGLVNVDAVIPLKPYAGFARP